MSWFMSKWGSQSYALMRIVAGFLFLWHGTQKLFNVPAGGGGAPALITYGAGTIELVCGVLVMVGFYTRYAAFLASGEMAAAYWMGHGTQQLLPIENHGELAALFCFVFLYISSQGAGKWSLDSKRRGA